MFAWSCSNNRCTQTLSPQPPACQELIKKLLTATDEEMAEELKKVESWSFGKVSH